jgi:hypothetical protein
MRTIYPHWTFHLEVVLRSLKDLEVISSADPKSEEFAFLKSEAPEIVSEAHDALMAIERHLKMFEPNAYSIERNFTEH